MRTKEERTAAGDQQGSTSYIRCGGAGCSGFSRENGFGEATDLFAFANERQQGPSQARAAAAAARSAHSLVGAFARLAMPRTWLFNFGVISDIQYADCENGTNYFKTRVRYFRQSYEQLLRAAQSWSAEPRDGVGGWGGIAFVLQLGDLLDGCNRHLHPGASEQALAKLLAVFEQLPPGVVTHHCVGNHELYNMSHTVAVRSLWPTLAGVGSVAPKQLIDASCSDHVAYYSFSPHPGFRFVKVDHFDVAAMGHSLDSGEHALALEYLSINKNPVKTDSVGLEGLSQRFVAFNGAVGARQLTWLHDTLSAADRNREKVVIFGHQPILAGHADPRCLLWNYEAVCDVIGRHRCVVLHISGHEHSYWRARDARGVHHLSLPAVLETEPSSQGHGTCRVSDAGLQLDGFGDLPSGWYDFLPPLLDSVALGSRLTSPSIMQPIADAHAQATSEERLH